MTKMLLTFGLAFLLCYLYCWKKEIKDFRQEKIAKQIKMNRKNFNIDID